MLTIPQHRVKLVALLSAFAQSKWVKHLWFKGWTLAYFFYWLDRFSTDLDFDCLWTVDEWTFIQDMTIIIKLHWIIKDQYNKLNTYFWLLDYESHQMSIKIEINKRTRKNDIFQWQKLFGYEILCMDRSSMFTNKLVALTQRTKTVCRDLYDINFFLRQWFPINEALILERTWKSTHDYLQEVMLFIQKTFTKKMLLAWLWELLDTKQKHFVKEQLIENTIELLKLYGR